MDIETQLSINQVTSQSEAADEETKFSTNNINGQRCITPCCVDNPMGHLETNRQLDHTEITRNDLICVSDVSVFLILISSDTVIDGLSNNSQFSPDRIVVSHSKKKLIVLDVNGLFADIFIKGPFAMILTMIQDIDGNKIQIFGLKGKKFIRGPFVTIFYSFALTDFMWEFGHLESSLMVSGY
ncbi:hypothetical protein JHK87_052653 [Glycine soja]|nr:hypothetical protein JHK87_052653 [Glycine soja]